MEEKAKSKSVSLVPSLWLQVEAKAAAEYGGNRSDYLRTLVEQDLAGAVSIPAASDPRFLEKLFAAILPSRAERFHRLWDTRTKLSESPPSQAEMVEALLRTLIKLMEAEPTAALIDAFDSLPRAMHAELQRLASGQERDPNILRYTQPEEPARHVAEEQPAPQRTLRTLPLKPPKPPSTGTTP